MNHYVLGLIFNGKKDRVLLMKKKRPAWMKDKWNGIGGKIEDGETKFEAIHRESIEETGFDYVWTHTISFISPSGTIHVFKGISMAKNGIQFEQKEDELLGCSPLNDLPENLVSSLRWIIPMSLSSVQFPVILQQNELGR